MGDEDKKKEKWYPGKFVNRAMSRRADEQSSTERSQSSRQSRNSSALDTPSESYGNESNSFSYEDAFSQSTGETQESFASLSPSAKVTRPQAIARVKFLLHEIRYLTMQSAKISIELDGVACVLQQSDISGTIEKQFDLADVTSDFKIEISGVHITTGSPVSGIVLIPISSCFSFAGAPIPGKQAWREIYPYYEKMRLLDSLKIKKFRSGLADIPGSAMNKPIESLGFISCSVEVIPFQGKSCLPLFFAPNAPRTTSMCKAFDHDVEAVEATLVLNNARLNRDIDRLKNALFRPPQILQPFFSLPEVFVLITVFGFVCTGFGADKLPLVLVLALLANGIWAHSNRKFSHVTVWNDIGGATSMSTSLSVNSEEESKKPFAVTSVVLAVMKNNQNLQRSIASAAHNAEVLNNIFTFADPRVSLVVYGLLFFLAVLSKIWISIFSLSSLVFFVGSLIFVGFASVEFLNEQIPQLHASSIYHKHINAFRKVHSFFGILWSKVPDDLELTHRYIASLCVVNELGGEMSDSANNFAARAAAKEKESKK